MCQTVFCIRRPLPGLGFHDDYATVLGEDFQHGRCLKHPGDRPRERLVRDVRFVAVTYGNHSSRHKLVDADGLQEAGGFLRPRADVVQIALPEPVAHFPNTICGENRPGPERIRTDALEHRCVAVQSVRELAPHSVVDAGNDAGLRPPRLLVGDHAHDALGERAHACDVRRRRTLCDDDLFSPTRFSFGDRPGSTLDCSHDQHLAPHVVAVGFVVRVSHCREELSDLASELSSACFCESLELLDVRTMLLELNRLPQIRVERVGERIVAEAAERMHERDVTQLVVHCLSHCAIGRRDGGEFRDDEFGDSHSEVPGIRFLVSSDRACQGLPWGEVLENDSAPNRAVRTLTNDPQHVVREGHARIFREADGPALRHFGVAFRLELTVGVHVRDNGVEQGGGKGCEGRSRFMGVDHGFSRGTGCLSG